MSLKSMFDNKLAICRRTRVDASADAEEVARILTASASATINVWSGILLRSFSANEGTWYFSSASSYQCLLFGRTLLLRPCDLPFNQDITLKAFGIITSILDLEDKMAAAMGYSFADIVSYLDTQKHDITMAAQMCYLLFRALRILNCATTGMFDNLLSFLNTYVGVYTRFVDRAATHIGGSFATIANASIYTNEKRIENLWSLSCADALAAYLASVEAAKYMGVSTVDGEMIYDCDDELLEYLPEGK